MSTRRSPVYQVASGCEQISEELASEYRTFVVNQDGSTSEDGVSTDGEPDNSRIYALNNPRHSGRIRAYNEPRNLYLNTSGNYMTKVNSSDPYYHLVKCRSSSHRRPYPNSMSWQARNRKFKNPSELNDVGIQCNRSFMSDFEFESTVPKYIVRKEASPAVKYDGSLTRTKYQNKLVQQRKKLKKLRQLTKEYKKTQQQILREKFKANKEALAKLSLSCCALKNEQRKHDLSSSTVTGHFDSNLETSSGIPEAPCTSAN